jgi:hypothetical protein
LEAAAGRGRRRECGGEKIGKRKGCFVFRLWICRVFGVSRIWPGDLPQPKSRVYKLVRPKFEIADFLKFSTVYMKFGTIHLKFDIKFIFGHVRFFSPAEFLNPVKEWAGIGVGVLTNF